MPDRYDDDQNRTPTPPRPAGEGVRIIGAEEAASREAELSAGRLPENAPRFGDVPPRPSGPSPAVRFPLPEDAEARPMASAPPPDLPHWTEPPTGEVPRILVGDSGGDEDDTEAWSSLTQRQPRWRGEHGNDWDEPDFDDGSLAEQEGDRVGALDDNRPDPSQPFSFDEAEDDGDEAPPARPQTTRIRTRPADQPEPGYGQSGRAAERDLTVAVGVGVAILAVALLCFWRGPAWAAAFSTVVVVAAAAEAFDVFRRSGFKPATLLGLVGTASLMIGAYVKGERAVPLILALAVMFTMLWYLFGVVRARPAVNMGVTLLGLFWVGFLGSFASLLLRYPNHLGVRFLLGAVIAVVANDIGALFIGRQFGHVPLAPEISPNKTVEGFVGGLVVSVIVSLAIVANIKPWSFGSAFVLAIVVSVVGPVGDLCESMIKRDLG